MIRIIINYDNNDSYDNNNNNNNNNNNKLKIMQRHLD